jgi:hypothetical protein
MQFEKKKTVAAVKKAWLKEKIQILSSFNLKKTNNKRLFSNSKQPDVQNRNALMVAQP